MPIHAHSPSGFFPLVLCLAVGASGWSAPTSHSPELRAAWPDPAFDPLLQCHGEYPIAALDEYLSRARLGLRVPGIHGIVLDEQKRCIRVTVEDRETGRMAVLLMRAVAVPRRAVFMQLLARVEADSAGAAPHRRGT
jgi:hypothetical protein